MRIDEIVNSDRIDINLLCEASLDKKCVPRDR